MKLECRIRVITYVVMAVRTASSACRDGDHTDSNTRGCTASEALLPMRRCLLLARGLLSFLGPKCNMNNCHILYYDTHGLLCCDSWASKMLFRHLAQVTGGQGEQQHTAAQSRRERPVHRAQVRTSRWTSPFKNGPSDRPERTAAGPLPRHATDFFQDIHCHPAVQDNATQYHM